MTSAAYSAHPAVAVAAEVFLPALGAWAVAMPLLASKKGKLNRPDLFWMGALLSIALVYVIRFASRSSGWWFEPGLRYSTHTAVGIAFGMILSVLRPQLSPLVAILVAGYVWAMIYLHYHVLGDAISTAAVILPVCLVCHLAWLRRSAVG